MSVRRRLRGLFSSGAKKAGEASPCDSDTQNSFCGETASRVDLELLPAWGILLLTQVQASCDRRTALAQFLRELTEAVDCSENDSTSGHFRFVDYQLQKIIPLLRTVIEHADACSQETALCFNILQLLACSDDVARQSETSLGPSLVSLIGENLQAVCEQARKGKATLQVVCSRVACFEALLTVDPGQPFEAAASHGIKGLLSLLEHHLESLSEIPYSEGLIQCFKFAARAARWSRDAFDILTRHEQKFARQLLTVTEKDLSLVHLETEASLPALELRCVGLDCIENAYSFAVQHDIDFRLSDKGCSSMCQTILLSVGNEEPAFHDEIARTACPIEEDPLPSDQLWIFQDDGKIAPISRTGRPPLSFSIASSFDNSPGIVLQKLLDWFPHLCSISTVDEARILEVVIVVVRAVLRVFEPHHLSNQPSLMARAQLLSVDSGLQSTVLAFLQHLLHLLPFAAPVVRDSGLLDILCADFFIGHPCGRIGTKNLKARHESLYFDQLCANIIRFLAFMAIQGVGENTPECKTLARMIHILTASAVPESLTECFLSTNLICQSLCAIAQARGCGPIVEMDVISSIFVAIVRFNGFRSALSSSAAHGLNRALCMMCSSIEFLASLDSMVVIEMFSGGSSGVADLLIPLLFDEILQPFALHQMRKILCVQLDLNTSRDFRGIIGDICVHLNQMVSPRPCSDAAIQSISIIFRGMANAGHVSPQHQLLMTPLMKCAVNCLFSIGEIGENGTVLCLATLDAIYSITRSNKETSAIFQSEVTFNRLKSALLIVMGGICSQEVIDCAFHMAFDEDMRITQARAVKMLLQLGEHAEPHAQLLLARQLKCALDLHSSNSAVCSEANVIMECVRWLQLVDQSAGDGVELQSVITDVVTTLGRHSITVRELRRLFRLMRVWDSASLTFTLRMLSAVSSMAQLETPRSFFDLGKGTCGIRLPPLSKLLKGVAFTFSVWIRSSNSVSPNCAVVLSIHTIAGPVLLAIDDNHLIFLTWTKRAVFCHRFPISLSCNRWYHLAVIHKRSKGRAARLLSRSSLCSLSVILDGNLVGTADVASPGDDSKPGALVGTAPMSLFNPSSSKECNALLGSVPATVSVVSASPENATPQACNLSFVCFLGQLGPCQLFSEPLSFEQASVLSYFGPDKPFGRAADNYIRSTIAEMEGSLSYVEFSARLSHDKRLFSSKTAGGEARLLGPITCCLVRDIGSSLACVGGVTALLPLLRCRDLREVSVSDARKVIEMALQVMATMLGANRSNLLSFYQEHGFEAIGHLLAGQDHACLTESLLDKVLGLVLVTSGSAALVPAARCLLLDARIWAKAAPEVVARLCDRLPTLIASHESLCASVDFAELIDFAVAMISRMNRRDFKHSDFQHRCLQVADPKTAEIQTEHFHCLFRSLVYFAKDAGSLLALLKEFLRWTTASTIALNLEILEVGEFLRFAVALFQTGALDCILCLLQLMYNLEERVQNFKIALLHEIDTKRTFAFLIEMVVSRQTQSPPKELFIGLLRLFVGGPGWEEVVDLNSMPPPPPILSLPNLFIPVMRLCLLCETEVQFLAVKYLESILREDKESALLITSDRDWICLLLQGRYHAEGLDDKKVSAVYLSLVTVIHHAALVLHDNGGEVVQLSIAMAESLSLSPNFSWVEQITRHMLHDLVLTCSADARQGFSETKYCENVRDLIFLVEDFVFQTTLMGEDSNDMDVTTANLQKYLEFGRVCSVRGGDPCRSPMAFLTDDPEIHLRRSDNRWRDRDLALDTVSLVTDLEQYKETRIRKNGTQRAKASHSRVSTSRTMTVTSPKPAARQNSGLKASFLSSAPCETFARESHRPGGIRRVALRYLRSALVNLDDNLAYESLLASFVGLLSTCGAEPYSGHNHVELAAGACFLLDNVRHFQGKNPSRCDVALFAFHGVLAHCGSQFDEMCVAACSKCIRRIPFGGSENISADLMEQTYATTEMFELADAVFRPEVHRLQELELMVSAHSQARMEHCLTTCKQHIAHTGPASQNEEIGRLSQAFVADQQTLEEARCRLRERKLHDAAHFASWTWRRIWRSLSAERGPWAVHTVQSTRITWRIRRKEGAGRRRRMLKRKINGCQHEAASDTGLRISLNSARGTKESDAVVAAAAAAAARAATAHVDVDDEKNGEDEVQIQDLPGPIFNDLSGDSVLLETACIVVLPHFSVKGDLSLTGAFITFHRSPSESNDVDWVTGKCVCQLRPGEALEPGFKHKKWDISSVQEIHSRSHILRPVALELFVHGTPWFFAFPDRKIRSRVLHSLLAVHPKRNEIYQPRQRDARLARSLERWTRGELSNFDYLMEINTLAGRSYNDISQYPVFPWVICDYRSQKLDLQDERVYRDLSKPIGALDSSKLEQIMSRFLDPDSPEDPHALGQKFHYASPYSSPAFIMYYLIRLEPFASMHIQLQSGHFDTNRMFKSVATCWDGLMRDLSDVKELVPEFFYLPEMFRNCNNFNFQKAGEDPTGTSNGDVELPPWAQGSPKLFVDTQRAALESDYVSQHLHEWIDLVFGIKQQGPAALEAVNLFHPLCYEGFVNLEDVDPEYRDIFERRIIEFGQVPSVLFKNRHPKKSGPALEAQVNRFASHTSGYAFPVFEPDRPVIRIQWTPESIITVSSAGDASTHGWLPFPVTANNLCPFSFEMDPLGCRGQLDQMWLDHHGNATHRSVLTADAKLIISCCVGQNALRVMSSETGKLIQIAPSRLEQSQHEGLMKAGELYGEA